MVLLEQEVKVTYEEFNRWRVIPRTLVFSYGVMGIWVMDWYMKLPNPNEAQGAFVVVVTGAFAKIFDYYVNSGKND